VGCVEVSKVQATRGSQKGIRQVHTQAVGNDWLVCLTAWQPVWMSLLM